MSQSTILRLRVGDLVNVRSREHGRFVATIREVQETTYQVTRYFGEDTVTRLTVPHDAATLYLGAA